VIDTATTNVKFRRLVRAIAASVGCSAVVAKVRAVGHLELLWHLTMRSAKRGDIGSLDNVEIADEIGWEGDPDEVVAMLVEAGWLDECDRHRLVVHDWHEHCPGFVKRNIDRVGGFVCAAKRPLNCSGEQGSERFPTQVSTEAATPNPTKPNPTKPVASATPATASPIAAPASVDAPRPKRSRKAPSLPPDDPGFQRFYAAYPRREGPGPAREAFAKAVERIRGRDGPGGDDPVAWLAERASAYAASWRSRPAHDQQFIPHPSTWLNQERYDDDPQAWRTGDARIGPGQRYDPAAPRPVGAVAGAAADGF
jgi:hypothetical protein